MKLWIAEKPSVAKAIKNELGLIKSGQGFYECKGGNIITWCFGHLLEQAEPDAYLPADIPVSAKSGKKIWRLNDLPIFPKIWKLQVKNDKGVKSQIKTIKTLLSKADSVVNCGDPDREGQLLVDEILEFYRYKKPVQRFWVSAQDSASIQKGLRSLQANEKFKGMMLAARGRSRADWLLGMNLTRALTLTHSSKDKRELIAVGRVQTPTLALVAERDAAIKNFKPRPFYVFSAFLNAEGISFKASWRPKEGQGGLDESKRLIDKAIAQNLLGRLVKEKLAVVTSAASADKKSMQPKAYSLADIQLEASNRYGFSAQETLDTCQSLYETHKIASYPRSDCQFLPESQFADAKLVLSAVSKNCPGLAAFTSKANTSIKSPTWNDKKISAHHGIIPTQQAADWSALSDKEKKIYELISRRYIAQFYPAHEYLENEITFSIANETFVSKGRLIKVPGWKLLYSGKAETEADADSDENQKLPGLKKSDTAQVSKISAAEEMTKPPKPFTEGTLIAAMEKIHTVVENPEHKKLLKETDGIGTPATRAAIISELKRKGYLAPKGKKIEATELGVRLLSLVPTLVKNPVMTAIFENKLKQVEAGSLELSAFLSLQQKFILEQIEKEKSRLKK